MRRLQFINNTHIRFQSHLWAVGVSTLSFLLEAQTIIIMSSNKRSHPDHFVGLLCYKCKRTDFGGSARRLSSHVRYCNGPPQQSYYQKKKKKILHSDDSFTTCHHNGMSQFPFNMAHRNIVGNTNEVCFLWSRYFGQLIHNVTWFLLTSILNRLSWHHRIW